MLKVRNAEALLSQIKALRLRESTFQDTKQLADQYAGRVDYQGEPCRFEKCTLTIFLGSGRTEQPDYIEEALRFVGIRTYRVGGSVQVRDGRIMETGFEVYTEAKPGSAGGQWLGATAKASDHFSRSDYYYGRAQGLDEHPNRRVIHPHLTTLGGGQVLFAEITADSTTTEHERAFDFRLSCISSLKGCSELRELAPSAWDDFMALSKEPERRVEAPRDYGACSTRSLARIARDMDDILLVEIQKVFPIESMEDGTPQDVRFRIVEVLKGQTNKHLSRFPLEIPEDNNRNPGLPQSMFLPGN